MEVRIYILERRRAVRNSGADLTEEVITSPFTYMIQITFTYGKIVIHDGAVKFLPNDSSILLKYLSQYTTFLHSFVCFSS